VKFAKATAAHI